MSALPNRSAESINAISKPSNGSVMGLRNEKVKAKGR